MNQVQYEILTHLQRLLLYNSIDYEKAYITCKSRLKPNWTLTYMFPLFWNLLLWEMNWIIIALFSNYCDYSVSFSCIFLFRWVNNIENVRNDCELFKKKGVPQQRLQLFIFFFSYMFEIVLNRIFLYMPLIKWQTMKLEIGPSEITRSIWTWKAIKALISRQFNRF